MFPQLKGCTVAHYEETRHGGTPLAIYNASHPTKPMLVFSPLSHPKAQHMATSATMFGAGVKASADRIPAGFSLRFMLSSGLGVNAAMMAWGDRLLAWTGKPRTSMHRPDATSTIGYWTDNGGYYHYSTGCSHGGGPSCNRSETYEDVLPKVKAYHEAIKVPFRHWQFDSWFYPKDGSVRPGGGGGAVTNWTALPEVFPHGMAHIQSLLRMPMIMHNRQWSKHSDYLRHLRSSSGTSPSAARCPPTRPPSSSGSSSSRRGGGSRCTSRTGW